MTSFETLVNIIKEKSSCAYKASEMTESSYTEHSFRDGAGAHNTYSISKSVTGCAVGILEAEGRLSDTDTVYSHIGDLFPSGSDENWKKVTLRDVMLHKTGTASVANIDIDTMDFRADGRIDFLKHILSCPIVNEPGGGPFIYSDTNYYLIGRVVERVAGMTCGDFLQERMFNCLEWRGNAWGNCPQNHTLCGTGLFTRIRDLAAYGLMLACGGEYKGKRILTQSWIDKACGEPGCYGYGFTRSENGEWFYAGGMYGQGVFVFPKTRTSFAVLGHGIPTEEIKKVIGSLY